MHSRIQTPGRRGALAAIILLFCFSLLARADDKSTKLSNQEVEFGIQVARLGLWKEAVYRWQKAVELDPDNAKARNNLAVAYEQNGDFELAEEQYERALELDSGNRYIRQNYELFRESYEKRKRKERGNNH